MIFLRLVLDFIRAIKRVFLIVGRWLLRPLKWWRQRRT